MYVADSQHTSTLLACSHELWENMPVHKHSRHGRWAHRAQDKLTPILENQILQITAGHQLDTQAV